MIKDNFPIYNSTFGSPDELVNSKHNIYDVAKNISGNTKTKMRFILIAGSEEGFIRERVEKDAEILRELEFNVEYRCIKKYGHNYELWDKMLSVLLNEILPLRRYEHD